MHDDDHEDDGVMMRVYPSHGIPTIRVLQDTTCAILIATLRCQIVLPMLKAPKHPANFRMIFEV